MTGKGSSRPPEELELADLLQRGYRYALSLVHDEARAEDLVQDAWVAVLRCNGPRSRAYLFTAIRNRFIDLYRRERFMVIESLEAEGTGEAGAGVLAAELDEEVLADFESLSSALATLRAEEREALFLAVVEGYTAREIGELTGRPRGTVLSLIHRARKKLRQRLVGSEPGARP